VTKEASKALNVIIQEYAIEMTYLPYYGWTLRAWVYDEEYFNEGGNISEAILGLYRNIPHYGQKRT